MSLTETVRLSNGVEMPRFGLGLYKSVPGAESERAVLSALEAGYRRIDTASFYENEADVGRALRASGLKRESVFLTSKVWNTDLGYDRTLKAFDRSLKVSGLDYWDLYLIHWPIRGLYQESYRALEKVCREKRVRSIGVSNFLVKHLEALLPEVSVMPVLNQFEFHPRLQQPELREYCRRRDIQVEAWSPVMRGRVGEIPEICALAEKYRKTVFQITLRWEWQKGILVIPKSVNAERIRSNAALFDFSLSEEDMALMDALDRGERLGSDPNQV